MKIWLVNSYLLFTNLEDHMKQFALSFFLILFIFCFQNALAQEEIGDEEQSYRNPSFTQGATQSIFEDGQQLFGSNWEWMHPTPSGNSLYWVQALDASTWLMAGAGGTFQKTTDGGATWTVYKNVGGLSSTGTYRRLYDGHFFDASTGLVCGSGNTLARTTDGGATWDSVGVGTTSTIYDLFFLNDSVGFICGTTTIDLWKTTDAGLTWTKLAGALPSNGYGMWAIDEDSLLVASSSGNVVARLHLLQMLELPGHLQILVWELLQITMMLIFCPLCHKL
jgi:hypothetical protein